MKRFVRFLTILGLYAGRIVIMNLKRRSVQNVIFYQHTEHERSDIIGVTKNNKIFAISSSCRAYIFRQHFGLEITI